MCRPKVQPTFKTIIEGRTNFQLEKVTAANP